MGLIKKAFKAYIELKLKTGGTTKSIDPKYISYFAIIYDYRNQVIPIITMNIACEDELYGLIVKNRKKGKFALKISYKDEMAKNSSKIAAFPTQTFSYVLGNKTHNDHTKLNTKGDKSYRVINIGLVSNTMINLNRKSFNCIYKEVDSNTLMVLALTGLKMPVCEKLKYNTSYDVLIVPPVNTRYKFIKYIENMHPFYDSFLHYFMDFNKTYVTSDSSRDTKLPGDKELIIKVVDMNGEENISEGFKMSGSTVYCRVPAAQCVITKNQFSDNVVSKVKSVASDKESTKQIGVSGGEDDDPTFGELTKEIYVRSDQANLMTNKMETAKYTVSIYKENIHGEYYTPNRIINLTSKLPELAEYCGKYKIIDKKEIFKQNAEAFHTYVAITLMPVTDGGKGTSMSDDTTDSSTSNASSNSTSSSMSGGSSGGSGGSSTPVSSSHTKVSSQGTTRAANADITSSRSLINGLNARNVSAATALSMTREESELHDDIEKLKNHTLFIINEMKSSHNYIRSILQEMGVVKTTNTYNEDDEDIDNEDEYIEDDTPSTDNTSSEEQEENMNNEIDEANRKLELLKLIKDTIEFMNNIK